MANKVDAATIVVAALRERVAALHAAADPAARLEAAGPDGTGADGGDTEPVEVGRQDADQRLALRDAVRALDALVDGFGPLLDRETTGPLRADLAWALDLLDPLVGADAAQELVEELLDDLDPTLVNGPVSTRVSLVERERERGAERAVGELLASSRWDSLQEQADRLVIEAPLAKKARSGAKGVLAGLVAEQDQAMAADVDALRSAEPATAGHDLGGVAADGVRLAYLADAARVVHGKQARALADSSRAVADAAADHATATAAAQLLVDLADQAHRAGEPGFSYGRLHAATGARRAAAQEELADALAAWSKPKRHKWLHD